MTRIMSIVIGLALLGIAVSAEPIYFEGCGQLVQGFGCVQFWPIYANPPGGILVPQDIGSYNVGDIVYITGEYDPDFVVVDCGGSPMGWNTIGDCQPQSCCQGLRGDINADGTEDIGDVTAMIAHFFVPPYPPFPCPEEADINADGVIDIGDLTKFIQCLFIIPDNCVFPPCPGYAP